MTILIFVSNLEEQHDIERSKSIEIKRCERLNLMGIGHPTCFYVKLCWDMMVSKWRGWELSLNRGGSQKGSSLSLSFFVCLSVCLYVCLSVCLSVSIYSSISIYIECIRRIKLIKMENFSQLVSVMGFLHENCYFWGEAS